MNSQDSSITALVESDATSIGRWSPIVGMELNGLLATQEFRSESDRRTVEQSSIRILSQCIGPDETNVKNTGLVVGYVQSGKTRSYTAVMAAANDNGYRLIIIIAGSTKNLLGQTKSRLEEDLNILGSPKRPWKLFTSPFGDELRRELRAALKNTGTKRRRAKTILLTTLKHPSHLQALTDLLNRISPELKKTALIIDDEGDQASLNTLVRKGERSATYRAIQGLRDSLPSHSYIQYTATPQANLFIPLIDDLSPEYCEVLEPGGGYIGGNYFFSQGVSDHISLIPTNELPGQWTQLEPPSALESALRVFLIGVAAGYIKEEDDNEHRTMMIHPTRETDPHESYVDWIRELIRSWKNLLDDESPDYEDLENEFRGSYNDLLKTVGDEMPDFNEIMEELKGGVLDEIGIKVINRNIVMDPQEWKQNYAWILIGGQKLDRGFTVEGLTVTYMPRSPGVGNADTVQQRGRFFGYKSDYAAYCRVYLDPQTDTFFQLYLESEESMRRFLEKNKRNLKEPEITRQFQMDAMMRPCRSIVLQQDPTHISLNRGWFEQQSPHEKPELCDENKKVIDEFVANLGLEINFENDVNEWLKDSTRSLETHQHSASDTIPLQTMYQQLLGNLVVGSAADAVRWQFALALIEDYLEHLDEATAEVPPVATVIWIRPGITTKRQINDQGKILTFAMGAHPPRAENYVYLGDSEVKRGCTTLQVHQLDLYEGPVRSTPNPSWTDVTTLRLWVNDDIVKTFIRQ